MNLKNTEIIKKVSLAGGVELSLLKDSGTGKRIIHRFAPRGKVNNYIENYEFISSNHESSLLPLDDEKATQIIERIEKGDPYSSSFIFYEESIVEEEIVREKSIEEHTYTSTGIKFWRHEQQMLSYKNGGGESVISTHISPEGACNLKCPYCSVTYRDTHSRIELDTIKDYIIKLQSRGLKAVILTGGGEPTGYKYFNELVQWIKYERKLSIALITNGTLVKRLEKKTLNAFSWIRISVNLFDQWESRIGNNFDASSLNSDCIVGCSMVYTVEHESTEEMLTDRVELLKKVSKIADRVNARYIRLLPNCLLEQKHLTAQHKALDNTLQKVEDSRFFHQYKVHGAPSSHICHQAYFRPYLSEEPYKKTGAPGTVYPCDSVVLNDSYQHFAEEYQLCAPGEILDFLDKKISPRFDPRERCKGCVFTENVNMLDDWKNNKVNNFQNYRNAMKHEEFV
jgi:MoaA/NifB/PqqE/SkfB family radical SAM enzyme